MDRCSRGFTKMTWYMLFLIQLISNNYLTVADQKIQGIFER